MTDTNKRYYWLKLKDDFFRQKEIKQLRRIAGGDSFTIIYLKMLLRSLKDDGKLFYDGVDTDFVSELALDIDEDVENVKMTVAFLMSKGILVQSDTDEYALLTAGEMTGSEGFSAERMRRLREKRLIASHSDALVTSGDEEKREKREDKREKRKREEATPSQGFLDFWAVYPRKVKRKDALIAWNAAKLDSIADEIIADVKLRCETEWKGRDMNYILHPTSYIHQRRWEDETAPTERKDFAPRASQPNAALNYEQRDYGEDYGNDLFIDLDKYGGGGN